MHKYSKTEKLEVDTDGAALNIRSSANTWSSVVGSLDNGTTFTYSERADYSDGSKWGRISSPVSGWVCLYSGSEWYVKDIAPPKPEYEIFDSSGAFIVDTGGSVLNMRTEPSVNTGSVKGSLSDGTKITFDKRAVSRDGKKWVFVNGSTNGWFCIYDGSQWLVKDVPVGPDWTEYSESGEFIVDTGGDVLNVRNKPSMKSGSVKGSMKNGTRFSYSKRAVSNDGKKWAYVSSPVTGWVCIHDGSQWLVKDVPVAPEWTEYSENGNFVVDTGGDVLNVRNKPSVNQGSVQGTLKNGTSFSYTKRAVSKDGKKWAYVNSPISGWVCIHDGSEWLVKDAASPPSPKPSTPDWTEYNENNTYVVSTDGAGLNVRNKPTLNGSSVVKTLSDGTTVNCTKRAVSKDGKKWAYSSDIGGWICIHDGSDWLVK